MKIAVFETSQGVLELKIDSKLAPQAAFNFMALVKNSVYDDTLFHRVIPNFMIQGGSLKGELSSSVFKKPFEDEITPVVNFARPGVLAMANCGPNTNGSQFFITLAPAEWLNTHHTIFGEVYSGFTVLWKIARMPTGKKDKPIDDQKIIKAYMKKIDT